MSFVYKFDFSSGASICFGLYPQTRVMDKDLIYKLLYITGNKPTINLINGFTSYQYYISLSNNTNYMYYKDISYNNELYRCVYFDKYRPYYTDYPSNSEYTLQYRNKYLTEHYYFFKFEPIKWRILEESNGNATLISDLILDSMEYNYDKKYHIVDGKKIFANDYEYSSIRKWLNNTFVNTAFSLEEQAIINKVEVDNSETITYGYKFNRYASNNTFDKVYLLSYNEAFNLYYNLNIERKKKTTDYALCNGLGYSDRYDAGIWWLRSPYFKMSNVAITVDYCGKRYCSNTNACSFGVCPVINITL